MKLVHEKIIFFIVFLLGFSGLVGQQQTPEYLIFKKDTIPFFSYPLRDLLEVDGYFDRKRFPNFGLAKGTYFDDACIRGIIGHWELKNDSLFLVNILGYPNIELPDSLWESLFNELGNSKNFAKWFNGKIVVPGRKNVKYLHTESQTLFEEELLLVFKNGRCLTKRKIKRKQFPKLEQFENKKRMLAVQLVDTLLFYIQKKYLKDLALEEKLNKRGKELVRVMIVDCDEDFYLTFNRCGRIVNVKYDMYYAGFSEKVTLFNKIEDWWATYIDEDERVCVRLIQNALKNYQVPKNIRPSKKFSIPFYLQGEDFDNLDTLRKENQHQKFWWNSDWDFMYSNYPK